MTFLPDGSLVATANAPKGGRHDGGGAVWWARSPVGATAPVLLERFADLKPEGVTRAPQGGLAIVFDRHGEQPQWMELAPPRQPAP